MRVLIAGGFGYIGGRLAQALLAKGHTITLGTRQNRTPPSWLDNSNVALMEWNSDKKLSQICDQQDVVIQAAGMNAQDCVQFPKEARKFNGEATNKLLNCSVASGVSRFVYLSTTHVYMSSLLGDISEDTPTGNRHPYATSHLLGEQSVIKMTKQRLIDGVVLRISNGFGAPTTTSSKCWSLLICDLCRQVVETGTIRLKSNIGNQRDFIPMADICSAIASITESEEKVYCSDPINLTSERTMSLIEVATLIQSRSQKLFSKTPKIIAPPHDGKFKNLQHLQFINKNISRFPIQLELNFEKEIDNLLRFCAHNFARAGK